MRGEAITQFMWGFQHHFRSGLGFAVEHALGHIGIQTEPDVYLIGFLAEGGDRHQICIEPETGPFSPTHFASVLQRSATLFDEDPERQIRHSNARLDNTRQAGLRDLARARATRDVFEAARPEMTFFVGRSVLVEQHEVHPVIGLATSIVDEVPALRTRVRNRIGISVSLLEAVIVEILRLAGRALYLPDAGSSVDVLNAESAEIVRRAAREVTESTAVLSGQIMGYGLFDRLNQISTLRYERREGIGSLLLASPDNPALKTAIGFEPIELSEHRAVRKMLELSAGDRLALLVDGRSIFGLGQLASGYDESQESAFTIQVVGEGTWEVAHNGSPLLRVEFGNPVLPRPRIDEGIFRDILNRVFLHTGGARVDLLWDLTLAAADAEHGTMLVISSSVAHEANRLATQSMRVKPTAASPILIAEVSKVDGAVLLAPDGTCHAIGVIVDGLAGLVGDRSRGARYNSAVRYLASTQAATAIVLVSEDGMVEVLPNLKPRIPRDSPIAILGELAATEKLDPPDFEKFFRLFERLERLEFYLSQDQCDGANQLRNAMEERRWQGNQMRISHRDLAPSSEMNDSYFLND